MGQSKKIVIPVLISLSLLALYLSLQSKPARNEVSQVDEKDSVASTASSQDQTSNCADESSAWKRVRELEEELARLKKENQQSNGPTAVVTAEDPERASIPTEVNPAANFTPEQKTDSSSSASVAVNAPANPVLEKEIRNASNSEDDDRALLKKLDLPQPSQTIKLAQNVPEEKIHQIKGNYQGKFFFKDGTVGSMELVLNLEDVGGKKVGTVNAKIINATGKSISNTHGTSSSIGLKAADGSTAYLLNIGSFEAIQLYVKDNANILGNLYEREEPETPLKKKGEYILTKTD